MYVIQMCDIHWNVRLCYNKKWLLRKIEPKNDDDDDGGDTLEM